MENEAVKQKSEYSFFAIDTHEARWRPALYLSWQQIKHIPNPKFLGITYDRQLPLGLHAPTGSSRMKQRDRALWCLALTDLGCEKSILQSTYIATGKSTVEYAAVAWIPWVSLSTMEKLKMCQRYSGWPITGQIKTTPVEAFITEADLWTVATRATILTTMAMEKSLRMHDANPRRQIATADVRQRTITTI